MKSNRRATVATGFAQQMRHSNSSYSFSQRLSAIPRMIAAAVSGRYRGMSTTKLVAIAAGVGYIISPVDLLPEALFLIFGLADDLLVGGLLASALLAEVDEFLRWEEQTSPANTKNRPVVGSTVRG